MTAAQERPLAFAPTPRLRRLALVAALAIVAAIVTARGELAVVAVAPLVLLAASPRGALPRTLLVSCSLGPRRCVEDDELGLVVEVTVPGADRIETALARPPHTEVRLEHRSTDGPSTTARWTVVPHRWGRYGVGPLRLRVVAGHGMYAATLDLPVGEIVVYPAGGALARPVAPRELPARLGEHASRAIGSGVEFAGVRPYSPGDRRRDIDWRTTARQQRLFVRQYAAERGFDLVAVLDVGVDAGEEGRSTLDLTVRAATGLAQTYLKAHDRVGVVSLGGSLRWLTPVAGARQLYRICESVMEVRLDDSEVGASIARVPPAALPPGAFVCVLSPLLDDRPLEAVRDLRARGFNLLVVDVLTSGPRVADRSGLGRLALRVWRMEREAIRAELAGIGVPLLQWDGTGDLGGALLHAMRALRPEVRA
ncbi:MAG TPA: DUF58 domain-containing protein [Candidatus Eisenbacteria bacterium]|nr:DUF58 domain-containing protein [Candidatus Eisenbacteria bacterium]